jgi:hypothetical protein
MPKTFIVFLHRRYTVEYGGYAEVEAEDEEEAVERAISKYESGAIDLEPDFGTAEPTEDVRATGVEDGL